MFTNFKDQKTIEYATFRILTSSKNLDVYRVNHAILKKYASGVVFPEQLIGFKGDLYTVATGQYGDPNCVSVSKTRATGVGSYTKQYSTDEQLIAAENSGEDVYLWSGPCRSKKFIYPRTYFFLGLRQASKFAQDMIDKNVKSL